MSLVAGCALVVIILLHNPFVGSVGFATVPTTKVQHCVVLAQTLRSLLRQFFEKCDCAKQLVQHLSFLTAFSRL